MVADPEVLKSLLSGTKTTAYDQTYGKERTATYPTRICIDKPTRNSTQVLNIHDSLIQIEVFYSFFDLKDYISYCKDVYRYFNLSSVNFFVAGFKYLFIF